ncbi:MAG: hypothetical protein M0O96_01390 [Desulforhopalus sp.]|nr:hypothetical protein [Desulforhopalus sp.]
MINFAVDILNNQIISGWIFSKLLQKKPVTLSIYLDGNYVGQVVADKERKDVFNLRLHPTGRCGFTFVFPKDIDIGRHKNLTVRYGAFKASLFSVNISEIPFTFKKPLPQIFFMHIPKTAGSSFDNFVHRRYPAEAISARLESMDVQLYPKLTTDKKYLVGHLPLGKFKKYFTLEDYALYTIVREPWRHLHSHLNWIRNIGKNPESGFYRTHPTCVRKLADSLNDPNTEISEQLKQLINRMDGFEFDFFDNMQTRYFLDYRPERVGDKDIANAVENFKYFADIGRTEGYQEFAARFCKKYNLPFIQQGQPLNCSGDAPLYDITGEKFQTLLHPLVKYDLQLYSAIVAREKNG